MEIRQIEQPTPRLDTQDVSNLSIQSYGKDNLYPQTARMLIACSETGSVCLNRFIKFIRGNGFKDLGFAAMVLNRKGQTADDILQLVANDKGRYDGFALQVNYNILGEIVEVQHVHFDHCRLGVADDSGHVSHICVFPDWSGTKTRNGKPLRPTQESIDRIPVFNPRKEVVLAQIEAAGGIENYKGQILWCSEAGEFEYPVPIYDPLVSYLSTEEAIGNICYRNARNGFFPAGMIITRKGQNVDPEEEENPTRRRNATNGITQALEQFQGDTNLGKFIHMEVDFEEEKPEFVSVQGENYDKDFTVTTDTTERKIYATFEQEIWYRIKHGSIGFSSEIMQTAYKYLSSVTGDQRRTIERAFDKVIQHWHKPIDLQKTEIQPLKYISSE